MDLLSQEFFSTSQLVVLNKFAGNNIYLYIKDSLKQPEITEKDKAFRRISKFWKRTGNSDKIEPDTVKNTELIRSYSVFKMLEFLDSDSPLLRYSAKQWLEETSNMKFI